MRFAIACWLTVQVAMCGVVVGPTDATVLSGGEATSGDVKHIIDQSGLSQPYVSGVTDFDVYVAGNPTHNIEYEGNEWYGAFGETRASILLDLGMSLSLTRMLFWNEESTGTDSINLYSCADPSCLQSTLVGGSFRPTNHDVDDYAADVFTFTPFEARFLRLDVTGPQDPNIGYISPAIGEVAFESASFTPVPEPSPLLLMASGVVALVVRLKYKKPSEGRGWVSVLCGRGRVKRLVV